jgi:hypothetical protein
VHLLIDDDDVDVDDDDHDDDDDDDDGRVDAISASEVTCP